ncbi:MAG: metallophosphoesterase [Longimicrobiales bacterium]
MSLRSLAGLGLTAASAACATSPFVAPSFDPVPPPATSDVAAVVFLVGDAGDLPREESPVLHRLRADVEEWSAALPDGSATVLYLGDNVYPVGVRDPGSDPFAADSARLAAQVWAATGPEARRRGTRVWFLPGNHDWGNTTGPVGVARLHNQADLLARLAPGTALAPPPGEPGPVVLDLADAARVMLLDTHWWLQSGDEAAREASLGRLSQALLEAGSRPTIVAAHHPWATGGPHGGGVLDPFFLLRKAGALIQDLNAPPFQALKAGLARAFREGNRPLVYVAGHDHSLQVLNTAGPGSPAWSLVSGAGSKLSPVSDTPGLLWAGARPGYMRLVVERDGGVTLFVEAAPTAAPPCADGAATCVARTAEAFSTVYSTRLR